MLLKLLSLVDVGADVDSVDHQILLNRQSITDLGTVDQYSAAGWLRTQVDRIM